MEPEHDDYPEQVIAAVRSAEVLSIFFLRVGRSLILDLRKSDRTAPAVLLDGMVESPQMRLASFSRLRPDLPLPERLTLVPWPGAIRGFAETKILDAVIHRCRMEGGEPLAAKAQALYAELQRLERQALRDLVRGVGMETIWQREAEG